MARYQCWGILRWKRDVGVHRPPHTVMTKGRVVQKQWGKPKYSQIPENIWKPRDIMVLLVRWWGWGRKDGVVRWCGGQKINLATARCATRYVGCSVAPLAGGRLPRWLVRGALMGHTPTRWQRVVFVLSRPQHSFFWPHSERRMEDLALRYLQSSWETVSLFLVP